MANNATLPATGTVVESIDETGSGLERQVITIGGVGSTLNPEQQINLYNSLPTSITDKADSSLTHHQLLQLILLELRVLTRQIFEMNTSQLSETDDPEAMRNDPTLFPN